MMHPTMINATIALLIIVGALIGLAQIARRFGLAGAVERHLTAGTGPGRRMSLKLDRTRSLSIVELDGCRFAVLTGGRTDQLLALGGTDRERAA